MRLQTTVQLDSTNWTLRSSGRFQYCKVWVNEQYAGMLLLKDSCDLSPYLRKGENRLELELMSSNRNLFGPHHVKGNPEPLAVTPDMFSRYGSWQEDASPTFTPEYAVVRFGMDTLYLEQ